jgi:serine protease Do
MEYVRPKEPALAVSKPIDEYLEVDNELRKFGRVRRAFVGLILAPDSAGVSRSTCNTNGMGVLVTGTMHDSPARAAGVLAGDVVVTIADVKVSSPAMLAYAMRGVRPGMKVQLDVCRKETKVVMMVEAAAMQSR